jgi:hypothetical protein
LGLAAFHFWQKACSWNRKLRSKELHNVYYADGIVTDVK